MKNIFLLAILMLGFTVSAQSYTDVSYSYLEVKNSAGVNFLDVKLTYDKYTDCYNNIQLFAQDYDINLYFQIYADDVKVYDGWARMDANTSYYLDDAFYDCDSSTNEIEIRTQPRN